jgi:hypothetical protein
VRLGIVVIALIWALQNTGPLREAARLLQALRLCVPRIQLYLLITSYKHHVDGIFFPLLFSLSLSLGAHDVMAFSSVIT